MIAVTELIGASLSKPELRAEVISRMRPWLELVQEVLKHELARSPFQMLTPAAEPAAFAVVAAYLGLNMLARFMPDRVEMDALFLLMEQFAASSPSKARRSMIRRPARRESRRAGTLPGPVALGGESAVP